MDSYVIFYVNHLTGDLQCVDVGLDYMGETVKRWLSDHPCAKAFVQRIDPHGLYTIEDHTAR
jgi:hypothetical protein